MYGNIIACIIVAKTFATTGHYYKNCCDGKYIYFVKVIRSIFQQNLNMKKSTFKEHSVSRSGASIFHAFFSHFYVILFLFFYLSDNYCDEQLNTSDF